MIDMPQDMLEKISNALPNGTPCLLATADADGRPDIGPNGSMMGFDSQHLAYWERTMRQHLANLNENPNVVVLYWDRANRINWRFHGSVEVYTEGPIREQIMVHTLKVEIDRDTERKGCGILIRVDKITNLGGQVLQSRE